jgi:murein L,D-transpeptidase YcbB/YkuD
MRFYQQADFQQVWNKPQSESGYTWEALLMLDCVLQFGLSHADYHPEELLYGKLHVILEQPKNVSVEQKAIFDIMLTDAMLNFINNLHFGKLNPEYGSSKIDSGLPNFDAESILQDAIKQEKLWNRIVSVQPRSDEYRYLQDQMHLVNGLHAGDCYEVPEADIRKMAINMERLRWAAINEPYYIQINIPSYKLKVYQKDSIYQFKVIVGKPATPTPTLQSAITYFTVASQWNVLNGIIVNEIAPRALANAGYLKNNHLFIYDVRGNHIQPSPSNLNKVKHNPSNYHVQQTPRRDNSVGVIVFRFDNVFDIYLHETPEKGLFKKRSRAFSQGSIGVESAEKLAVLLLKFDSAVNKIKVVSHTIATYQTKTFVLNKPVPIKITYITCEVVNGALVNYEDIYGLDAGLEMAMYNIDKEQASR